MGRAKSEQKEKFWQRHLEEIAKYPGSASEYCRQQGLSRGVYDYWQRKLSSGKGLPDTRWGVSPTGRAFAEVIVERSHQPVVPDAKWLAEVIMYLHQGVGR